MSVLFACLSLALSQADPADILSTFEIDPNFELQLVAMEPLVFDPVDIEFDERGRAFVLEMPGYPFPDGDPGRVVLLTDDDGDGVYDSRKVYYEGFEIADSLLPWRGGFLVAAPPDLVFIQDTDGDDVADVRDVIMGGFEADNTQHNFNGLVLGLDGWVYGAHGGNGGKPHWADAPEAILPLGWHDFRVHLDDRIFEAVGRTSGGFGMSMDAYGRIFTTHNTQHITHIVFPGHYVEDFLSSREQTLDNISDHEENGLARIYPLGEQETRVNHPEQSGYFSGGCGITAYTGGAFGEGYNDSTFVCDVVLNLLHRDVIHADGATLRASRGEEKRDFLASTDRAFRPVNSSVGPDGALYVTDMHRAVIEHPEWIPDELEVNMDLNAGKDQGRIFRIVPKGGLKGEAPRFDASDLPGAVAALGHRNKWWRTTAQRLLVEWDSAEAVPLLRDAAGSGNAYQRLHAMWTLENLEALPEDVLIARIGDSDGGIRENALQIAATRTKPSQPLLAAVSGASGDEIARTRMYAILALASVGKAVGTSVATKALGEAVARDADDPWIRLALTAAYAPDPAEGIEYAARVPEIAGSQALAQDLAKMAVKASPRYLGRVLRTAREHGDTSPAFATALLEGAASGMPDGQSSDADLSAYFESSYGPLVRAAWRLSAALGLEQTEQQLAMLDEAKTIALDRSAPTAERLDALAMYAFADYGGREDALFELLDTRNPREVQVEAIHEIRNGGRAEAAERLVAMWDSLGPDTRSVASDILVYQRGNHDLLLSALEDGRLRIGQMNFDLERRRRLLLSNDESVKQRAEALFSDAGVVTRKEALEKMRPALTLTGDVEKGKAIFAELCLKCHQFGAEGAHVGPVLTEIYRKSRETLLHDILDPNAAVDTQYLSFSVELASDDVLSGGEIITGMIVAETDESVTLRQAGGEDRTVLRSEMASMRANGLSMMPEELEAGMEPQDVANLLAYLQTQP